MIENSKTQFKVKTDQQTPHDVTQRGLPPPQPLSGKYDREGGPAPPARAVGANIHHGPQPPASAQSQSSGPIRKLKAARSSDDCQVLPAATFASQQYWHALRHGARPKILGKRGSARWPGCRLKQQRPASVTATGPCPLAGPRRHSSISDEGAPSNMMAHTAQRR